MQFSVTVEGRIIKRDPELFFTPREVQGTKFELVHNPRYRNADGQWVDGRAQFFDVVCWGTLAQRVLDNLRQGDTVIVDGNGLYAHANGGFGHLKFNASNVALSLRFDAARSERAIEADAAPSAPEETTVLATTASAS